MKPTFKFPFIANQLSSAQGKQQQQQQQSNPAKRQAQATTPGLSESSTNSDSDSSKKFDIAPGRPILTHLNADTTWLLLLPYPPGAPNANNRKYFRILFDPWLSGPQSDYFTWFSTQWHAVTPALGSIDLVGEFISSVDPGATDGGRLDAVVISHEFTDHCHKATLMEVDKRVPVFANDKALEIIRGWKHFERVVEVGKFPKAGAEGWDWRKGAGEKGLLPEWIGMTRVESPGNALYYHSSVMVTWDMGMYVSTEQERGGAQCVLYTPHGTVADTLEGLKRCEPKVEVVALLHGLHDVRVGWLRYKQLNLGMRNAVKAVKGCNGGEGVRYWVGTHDEIKTAGGMVGRMLYRKTWKVEEVEEEGVKECYVEVGNGESLVLE
ncbi:hypothetical protein H072_10406 [Dactylellina haptotyla CBS 200.50]|uniref:Metallo-beta-lactamase domain-containing protein n=1 Tax=Dactylellina haptotyla (strain CBS 200.50) TaxID=1284197 RepID=S8A4H3_DACHA|nr:hypothetical protein H072_10406 [Dactylellina haptotyla CBS 200.50]